MFIHTRIQGDFMSTFARVVAAIFHSVFFVFSMLCHSIDSTCIEVSVRIENLKRQYFHKKKTNTNTHKYDIPVRVSSTCRNSRSDRLSINLELFFVENTHGRKNIVLNRKRIIDSSSRVDRG